MIVESCDLKAASCLDSVVLRDGQNKVGADVNKGKRHTTTPDTKATRRNH